MLIKVNMGHKFNLCTDIIPDNKYDVITNKMKIKHQYIYHFIITLNFILFHRYQQLSIYAKVDF